MAPTTVSIIAIIVVVVLALLAGLCLAIRAARRARLRGRAEVRHDLVSSALALGGGGGAGHHLGEALHDLRQGHVRAKERNSPPPGLLPAENKTSVVEGGAKNKPWTEYKSWDTLFASKRASSEYWNDLASVMTYLDLDWSRVRKELAGKLYADREWAGRINLVGGKPKVVEAVSSPYKVGEGPLSAQAGAMVPGKIIEALEAKPALFLFHTHPGEGLLPLPSPTDLATALATLHTGRFAADIVVSPTGIFMYTPSIELRNRLDSTPSDDPQKDLKDNLILVRHIIDMLGALEGTRSWGEYALDEYISVIRKYGIEYVSFPTDKYAKWDRRMTYKDRGTVDRDLIDGWVAVEQVILDEMEGKKEGGAPPPRRMGPTS